MKLNQKKKTLNAYDSLSEKHPILHDIMTITDFIKEVKQDPEDAIILLGHLGIALDELSGLPVYAIKKYWEIAYEVIARELFLGPRCDTDSQDYAVTKLQYYREFIKKANKAFKMRPFELEVITYYAGHAVLRPSKFGRPRYDNQTCKILFDEYYELLQDCDATPKVADTFCKTLGDKLPNLYKLYEETDQARVLKLYESALPQYMPY